MNKVHQTTPSPEIAQSANNPAGSKPANIHSPPSHQPNPAVVAPSKPDPAKPDPATLDPAKPNNTPDKRVGPGDSRTR